MDKLDRPSEDSETEIEAQSQRKEFIQSPTFWIVMWFVLGSVVKTVISFVTLQFLRPCWTWVVSKYRKEEDEEQVV